MIYDILKSRNVENPTLKKVAPLTTSFSFHEVVYCMRETGSFAVYLHFAATAREEKTQTQAAGDG